MRLGQARLKTSLAAILLEDSDEQMRLEAAVTLAETRTPCSFNLLRTVLQDAAEPVFLRSACAWALGCHCTKEAVLVRAFADVACEIREEAPVALHHIGGVGFDPLVRGLDSSSAAVAAGAAETLRRIAGAPAEKIAVLAERGSSTWPTWTLAHLPKESFAPYLAALQAHRPEVHYAISVLWNLLDNWIANDWTPRATP